MVRECERAVRRHDQDSPYMSFAAVLAKEYIEKFVYALQLRAGSRLFAGPPGLGLFTSQRILPRSMAAARRRLSE